MPIAAKQNVGNAGEYYIAARLSALDFIATLTLGRTEKYDILALGPNGKLFKLSVKTTQLRNAIDFPLSEKDEHGEADDFYYAFVKLNNFETEPDFWIVSSTVVCPRIAEAHATWMKTPGKGGRPHSQSTMRIFPVIANKSQAPLFPEGWNEYVKQYYKNLSQLQ